MNVTVLTDASFDDRYKIGGYGYWIACGRGKHPGGGLLRGAVKNALQAEMMAICRALYDGVKLRLIEPGDFVLVQTDCQGAIDSFRRLGTTAPDPLVSAVFDQLLEKHNLKIRFKHVKGHTSFREARFAANRVVDGFLRAGE